MFKHIKHILFLYIGLLALGYFAMVCVYALPTEPIKQNVAEAANIIDTEGSHPELIYGHQDTILDNQTDSIMLLNACHEKSGNLFEESLLVKRTAINGMTDAEIIGEKAFIDHPERIEISYGRYWHGYLLYLKPLLMLFNYGQIRYLIGWIQTTLFAAIVCLMIKKNKQKHLLPFGVAYLFLNPAALGLSLQYLPVSVIMMLQFIVILLREEKYQNNLERWMYHFFVVGCLTSYFDFLTYPMLTLGMPLIYLLSENRQEIKKILTFFVSSCVFWGLGYVSMWAGKWILGSLLTTDNVIADAFGNVLLRVGAVENEVSVSAFEVIVKNIGANKLTLAASILVCIGLVFYRVLRKNKMNMNNVNIGVLLCAALPVLWYSVVSNHSYIHFWFTYRILAISIYSVLLFVTLLFDREK